MRSQDKRLLRSIKHSKGQFASVTVIIAAALCIYVMFNMLTYNINSAAEKYYQMTAMQDLAVQVMSMPEGAVDALMNIEGVKAVQGRVSVDVPLNTNNEEERVTVRLISVPSGDSAVNRLYILDGISFRMDPDSTIVLQQFAQARNIKIGDVLTPNISGVRYKLNVTGIAASSEFVYLMENEQSLLPAPTGFGVLYVNEDFLQSAYGYENSYNEVLITADKGIDLNLLEDKIDSALSKYGVKRITQRKDQVSNNILVQKMDGVQMMSNMIPVMFLGVAAIVIIIMLSRMVAADRIAIGVLKAMGYSNTSVLMYYVKYALAIGITGATIGMSAGMWLAGPMSRMFVIYFNIPIVVAHIMPGFLFTGILLTGFFCVGSGLAGARTAIRIMPAESMRPETPKSGTHSIVERLGFLWSRLDMCWRMVLRNISRTKRRFLFMTLGMALAYAINTVPLYESAALVAMFELQFSEYQQMDYVVNFSRPVNESTLKDLSDITNSSVAEPRIDYPCELKFGWRNKQIGVIAIPPDTKVFTFKNLQNESVAVNKEGIYLTESLGKALGAKVGDTIVMKNSIPGKKEIEIRVVGIVQQYLGSNAYMEIGYLQKLLGQRNAITSAMLITDSDAKEILKDAKNVSSITSIGDLKDTFEEYTNTMQLAISFYMLFGGILGFAIIYNATIINIAERSQEFSALRVMGYERKEIIRMLNRENGLMTICAIALGIPLGLFFINGIIESFSSDLVTFVRIYPLSIFIYAALGILAFTVIAQLAARKKIAGLNFLDVLKSRIT